MKFHFKRIFILFAYAIPTFFSLNCKNDIINPPISTPIDTLNSGEYFLWPYHSNTYWIYNEYIFPFENHETTWVYRNFNSFGLRLDTLLVTNIFKREIHDSTFLVINDTVFICHTITNYINNENRDFNEIFWVGKEGVYSMGAFDGKGNKTLNKGLYLSAELKLNEPWRSQIVFKGPSGFSSIVPIDKRLISINDTISTPLGKISCYTIRTIIDPKEDYPGYYYYYEYYSPNIGLVAKVRIFLLPDHYWFLDYIELLKNFKLNNVETKKE